MTAALCIFGYIVAGGLALGLVVASRVANDVEVWVDPLPLLAAAFWPIVLPWFIAFIVAERIGGRSRAEAERIKKERSEQERLLHEAGL